MIKILHALLAMMLIHSPLVLGETMEKEKIMLPKPSYEGKVSVEKAIKNRRTVRSFRPDPLTLSQLSQLLWAAQGITDKGRGFRSAPSAGALYPLDVYVVVGKEGVEGMDAGVYRYLPQEHVLEKMADGDRRNRLAQGALRQMWIEQAPVVFVITAEYSRITGKYGRRGLRYAQIEVGHVGQNIFLQAEALNLSAGIVGAFDDDTIAETIEVLDQHEPLLIMPLGHEK